LEKIWAKPFLVGESDLSVMVKDIDVIPVSKLKAETEGGRYQVRRLMLHIDRSSQGLSS
jgi:hypothetical protein